MKIRKKLQILLLCILVTGICGYICKRIQKTIRGLNEKINKFKNYYNILNEWLRVKHTGVKLDQYFVQNGYKSVAIYGMGEMGKRLYEELMNSDICVKCAIDKNASGIYSELEVYEKIEDAPDVDAIVVTATFAYDEILQELQDKVNGSIVSLEDVVFEI